MDTFCFFISFPSSSLISSSDNPGPSPRTILFQRLLPSFKVGAPLVSPSSFLIVLTSSLPKLPHPLFLILFSPFLPSSSSLSLKLSCARDNFVPDPWIRFFFLDLSTVCSTLLSCFVCHPILVAVLPTSFLVKNWLCVCASWFVAHFVNYDNNLRYKFNKFCAN